jgi:hypothetical protein
MEMIISRLLLRHKLLLAAAFLCLVCPSNSFAQTFNNGPILPGQIGSDMTDDTPKQGLFGGTQAAPAPSPTAAPPNGPGTIPGAGMDNTADEKRMQKKFKANRSHYKDLVVKGDAMMKSAPNKEDKTYKKGKILKEMGEKHLAEMQANSPFTMEDQDDKKKKVK